MKPHAAAAQLLLAAILVGCTSLAPHRTDYSKAPCDVSSRTAMTSECRTASWLRVLRAPGASAGDPVDYHVLFAEFDDMGLSYPKGGRDVGDAWNQIESALQSLEALSREPRLSLVVYVHGWKHDASADDRNVQEFHRMLQNISLVEQAFPKEQRRTVVGIYVGWRGLSATVEPFKEMTFWTRKTAALHVAQGSARHFLARLRAFQRVQNCKADPELCAPAYNKTATQLQSLKERAARSPVRMIIIGHSFGGLIVFNAISEYLIESLTEEGTGSTQRSHSAVPVQRFGDMVVLLNPAFEAIRYTPVQRVAARRSYDHYQAPILVLITSTADVATRVFFKAGRQLNSMFERKASEEEAVANVNTPGNVEAYITHDLTRRAGLGVCPGWRESPQTAEQIAANLRLEQAAASAFMKEWGRQTDDGRLALPPSWRRAFCGDTLLTHRAVEEQSDSPYARNDPNSPIWNVRTDASLIPSHSEIDGALIGSFIRQLYHDSATFPRAF